MSRPKNSKSKREQARLAAQRARELQARRALRVRLAMVVAIALVAAVAIALVISQANDDTLAGSAPGGSDGLLTGPPPWPAQPAGLEERIAALGFPPGGDESYHAHVLLSVYRNGQQVAVPANLGYDERGAHSSLHTHTPDGVVHMEADDPYPYELAHVMTTWGVAFDRNRLGGDTAEGDKKVHVYVNGEPTSGGPVVLEDGDNIVVAYGEAGSFPTEPPADALNGV